MEPFTARRSNGKIILEIDEHQFIADATSDPANNLRIIDREQFLDFVLKHVFTLTHDIDRDGAHPSWWLRLSETLAKAAASAECGLTRIEAVPPTCACDPEEHDGG